VAHPTAPYEPTSKWHSKYHLPDDFDAVALAPTHPLHAFIAADKSPLDNVMYALLSAGFQVVGILKNPICTVLEQNFFGSSSSLQLS